MKIPVQSPEASKDIIWWRDNILGVIAFLRRTPEVNLTNDQTINGRWNESEKLLHINELELLAIKHAVSSFLPLFPNTKHLRID